VRLILGHRAGQDGKRGCLPSSRRNPGLEPWVPVPLLPLSTYNANLGKELGPLGTEVRIWTTLSPHPCLRKTRVLLSLTSQLAVPGHSLGHEASSLVQAHHVGNLLLTLLGAGPGQGRQCVLAHDFTFRGEAIVSGLGSTLHTPRISMWWEASSPCQCLPSCCPTQVLAAWSLWWWGRRDPPVSSVPAGYCPYHLGHWHAWALSTAPPTPMPSACTAPPPC
jgi:hypothetical protein